MKIKEVTKALERFAPLPLQESWDNAGLQVGYHDAVGNRLHHGLLHIVLARQSGKLAEYQRMVRHDEVAALLYGLVHNLARNVQTQ